jgi:hypothetical protein
MILALARWDLSGGYGGINTQLYRCPRQRAALMH